MNKYSKIKDNSIIRLNKFIASSGYCSRRKADENIEAGHVKVNGKTVTDLGFKINPAAVVTIKNKRIYPIRQNIYIALNKPKDYISSKKDELDRKTIYSLLDKEIRNTVNSVGRLDRNTTGIILFTNDGDLAHLLTHPSSRISKEYRIRIDKDLSEIDYEQLKKGIEIDEEIFKIKNLRFNNSLQDISLSIHYGKNRIVRRIFESLGYKVKYLDRLSFAGISKKNLAVGKSRNLSVKEINMLKSFQKS